MAHFISYVEFDASEINRRDIMAHLFCIGRIILQYYIIVQGCNSVGSATICFIAVYYNIALRSIRKQDWLT